MTVQIAIAVYNDAAYLDRTLAALVAQTYRDFQVTVLDDGSTDESRAVAERYGSRLSLEVIAAPHGGRQEAKRAVAAATDQRAPYWMVLDSDILLPPRALEEMLAVLAERPEVGVVCARARAFPGRPLGASQALIEDLFYDSIEGPDGSIKWIVGGCALFRRECLATVTRHADVPEDNDLSQQLRGRWKFVAPRRLAADHLGVPTSLRGLFVRGLRDGVRVAAVLEAHPGERSIGNMARLMPLPLVSLGVLGAVTLQPWVAGLATLGLGGYVAAFAVATRRVPAPPTLRIAAGLAFCFMNVGFGWGYWRGAKAEPTRGV